MDYDYAQMNYDLDITKSNVFLRPDASFFGPLLCSLEFQWTKDVPTAATDFVKLVWNPDDFLRCKAEGKGEDISTLMHELWHNARLHDVRRGDRCPDIWNKACDYWINRELANSKYFIGSTWLLDPRFDKIETEEDIYDLLEKQGGGGGGGGCSHGHGKDGPMTPAQVKAALSSIVTAMQSAKMAGRPGDIPGNMEMIVNRFLTRVIPWEQHLNKWMSDLAEEDFTWARPNRRYLDM